MKTKRLFKNLILLTLLLILSNCKREEESPKDPDGLVGAWKLMTINGKPANQWIIDVYECPGQREDTFYSGTATFTADTMSLNMKEEFKYFKYNGSCSVTNYHESDLLHIVSANHNNTTNNQRVSIYNGKGNYDGDNNYTFTNGIIILEDQNTIKITYSYHDGYEVVNNEYKLVRE